MNITDGVWPGDTDDDTYVDNFDLLNIGLGYGQTGTPRNVITNVWNGYVTPLWNTATPISNIDYRHADSDGDGIVSALDTIAILQNYASSYQRGGTSILGGIPIQVGQDTGSIFPKYSLPILFGDLANPVTGLYGGAFSIAYDTSIIKVNSVSISFDTTWTGTKNIDIITIQKNLPNDNQVDAAFTRIDGNNVNGFGLIGQLNFTIKDDILQRRGFNADSVWTQFHIFDTKFISNDETLIEVDDFNEIKKTRKNGLHVFLDKTKDTIYFSDAFSLAVETLYAKEKRPQLKWKFVNETKKISKFNCKKATATFRGRKYIAWYTQEIPLPYGPWKIQGLPGMILEVKTDDNFIAILFKEIKYPVTNIPIPKTNNSVVPKNSKVYTFKEYIAWRYKYIEVTENSLKVQAKKFNVTVHPFSQRDNFIEIFEQKIK